MSVLSTLANIGVTVGKAVMSLLGGTNLVCNAGVEYRLGDTAYGDIYLILEKRGGKEYVILYNGSLHQDYSVSFPGENGEDGEVFILRRREELPVTDWFSDKYSPDKRFYISPLEDETNASDADAPNVLNLSFGNMKIKGDPVKLGGFSLSLTEADGVKGLQVTCENAMGLDTLRSCSLTNDKGISMLSSDPVPPSVQTANDAERKFYPLDYREHGLSEGDSVSGVINVEVKDGNVLAANCRMSRKLIPDEIKSALFRNV